MPKDTIDYSDTTIYKIYCKDETITDVYVGHTTNFPVRKYYHKNACNNSKIDINIYKTIRENGGWDNWNMVEIAKYNCKDSSEARIKEQEHYDTLKASLNSILHNKQEPKNVKQNETNLVPKSSKKYVCNICHYIASRQSQYARHILTDKHKKCQNETNETKSETKNPKKFQCHCGIILNSRTTMWRHKNTCLEPYDTPSVEQTKDDLVHLLVTQNNELMKLLKNGLVNTNINNTNSNNIHNTTNNIDNKTFNLNLFLNETCKEAMNMSDFVSSIKVNLEDLENTGKQGYIQGISNIILKNLNNLEQHFRPIHCSDCKREVFYIKENNEWQKENEEKPILTKAIKVIANENIKQIKLWRDKHPDCTDADSKKNNLYLKIVSNSMNGLTEEEGHKNINKIITNVEKKTFINKQL